MPNTMKKVQHFVHSHQDERVIRKFRFVYCIINHLTMNGIIEEHLLYEPPFTDVHETGLDGVFPKLANQLIAVLYGIDRSMLAASG